MKDFGKQRAQLRVSIEPADAGDRDAILAVMRHANMHHVPSPEMEDLDLSCFLVAKVGDRVVGAAGWKLVDHTHGKTTLLAVVPQCRGSGVGAALQWARMEAMHRAGVRTLTTNADRPETIAWYKEPFGYREVGRLAKLHEFGDPAVGHWTTLETDLPAQIAQRRAGGSVATRGRHPPLARALAATVYRELWVWERHVEAAPRERVPQIPVDITLLGADEVELYRELRPDTPPAETRRRLASGDRCFVARDREALVAARWVSTCRAESAFLGLTFELAQELAYLYDAYCSPRLRQLGVSSAVYSRISRLLHTEGYRALINMVFPQNTGAMRLASSAAISVGTVGCVRVGSRRLELRKLPPGYLGRADRFRPAA